MTKKINLILKEVLEKIEPTKQELYLIDNSVKEFIGTIKKRIKSLKIEAEVFIGGSFAKKTVIKKGAYDVDIFVRFHKKYKNENLSKLTEKLLKNIKRVSLIHGSRDYFRVGINPFFFIELIPTIRISKPSDAKNITDLSYSHVRYINRKIKNKKILDEIRIAKAFCHASNCYGAESYINGFSGYGLELLIYHYGNFLNFIKAAVKMGSKTVIDIEKQYKNKPAILMNLNSSKLHSPIILIDPTYKQRNVLAALSEDTFKEFKKNCEKFLKSPSIEAFEIKKTDLKKVHENAKKKKNEFVLIDVKTNKPEGSIAGSKLLKFYRHLHQEIENFFDIKEKGFDYNQKKTARLFFVVKSKKEILIGGPNVNDKKNIIKFKKKHRNTFVKSKRFYAKEKIKFNLKNFIESWKRKNIKKLRDMHIEKLSLSQSFFK